jgi:hypothetical protein
VILINLSKDKQIKQIMIIRNWNKRLKKVDNELFLLRIEVEIY